eukprot:TRINITY_DN19207_c0_g1_i1.p1 TRINITY_DN19207_c0_g1~~TRINITY_DN19207_c0_g1_i1.p1  ORF type:complete len:358 (+),score=30.69 TRINITY_DN19207_c0_g1_i1:262-1335(+)
MYRTFAIRDATVAHCLGPLTTFTPSTRQAPTSLPLLESLNKFLGQSLSEAVSVSALCQHTQKSTAKRGKKIILQAVQAGFGLNFDFSYENGLPGFLPGPTPTPVQFPRKPLDLRLAVLLMRSSYEACDDLDFVPMDRFQGNFWKLRQREVEPYVQQYSPLKMRTGDLTDPLYFDFISFAQYATIANSMRVGEQVFEERLGVDGGVRVVRRDEQLRDNASLPKAFKTRVGDRVYEGLREGFQGKDFGAPSACPVSAPPECLVAGVSHILRILTAGGYALTASVTTLPPPSADSSSFKVKVEGPASLWGARALASRRFAALTDFDAMAIGGFLRASHCEATYKSRYTDTAFEHVWTISR